MSSFLCMDIFFLSLQSIVCLYVLSLGSSPWWLYFNRNNKFACDSTFESDRSDYSSLGSAILACSVVKVLLSFFIYLFRFLILFFFLYWNFTCRRHCPFFLLLVGKMRRWMDLFCDNCSTLYLSSRPCRMIEYFFHHRFTGRSSFLVIKYFFEWLDQYTGSKYAEYSAEYLGICHPQQCSRCVCHPSV